MEDLLERAILNVRHKVLPHSKTSVAMVPEPHTQLYKLLQVYDIADQDIEDKVKFIYDYLKDSGDPKSQIIKIHSKIGALGSEELVGRVYKYCRLHKAATEARQQYVNLQKEINALGAPDKRRI